MKTKTSSQEDLLEEFSEYFAFFNSDDYFETFEDCGNSYTPSEPSTNLTSMKILNISGLTDDNVENE